SWWTNSNRRHSRSGVGSRSQSVTRVGARRPDDSGARGTQSPAAREPPTQAGAGDPLKGGGLVRSGDERDPTEGFRYVSDHQADDPIASFLHRWRSGVSIRRRLSYDFAAH